MNADDIRRIAESLIETGNLLLADGAAALDVTEGWEPGAKTANLDPDRGGDRYETVIMPDIDGDMVEVRVRIPSNDPTGEQVVNDSDQPANEMHAELVGNLNRMYLDSHRSRVIVKLAVPKHANLHIAGSDTGADVALAGWCRSCHRDHGYCEPVATRRDGSRRYSDYCNWCGEWVAANQKEPPLELLRAKHEGRRITQSMVEQVNRKKAS